MKKTNQKKVNKSPYAVGITGGIGSGKSTICKIFELLGIPIYYADKRAKAVMVEDEVLIKELKAAFGEETYHADGSLNREYLSSIVFEDKAKLTILNSLVHPAVFRDTSTWASRQNSPYTLREAAIAFESGSYKVLDKMITVYTPQEIRIKRVIERDGITREEVLRRIDNQMSEEEKIKLADYVIYNDGSTSLIKQVLAIHNKLLRIINKPKRKLRAKSLLWSVNKKGSTKTSFIFGSMHVKDHRAFQLVEQIQLIIQECDAFATEFDLAEADPVKIAQNAVLPNNLTLKDIMKPKAYNRLKSFLEKNLNIPIEAVERQKPFFISNMVALSSLQQDMEFALDEALYRFAVGHQKNMLGLETFDDQIQILNDIDLKVQVKYLMESIKQGNKQGDAVDKLAKYYLDQNIHKLYRKAKENMEGLEDIMIDNRNQHFANRFVEIIDSQSLFAVVGAAHLSGEKGVLKLLKAKGLIVKPYFLKS